MKILKKTLLACCALVPSLASFAQTATDSIPKRAIAYAADKFPIARALNIEFTHTAPYNFSPEQRGTAMPDGRVNGLNLAKVSANINFIKKRSWMLGATLSYKYLNSEAALTSPQPGRKGCYRKISTISLPRLILYTLHASLKKPPYLPLA
ncbi:hypothetical protein [Flavobacterium psychrotrophum]|uniref:hypothetical protein n=1 Tax=Flavobacterium psychrotrophum TaxID=2294119 RepID=UPI000E31D466|nr:hypothetical protein [Flavobacterium psychrotrophum]